MAKNKTKMNKYEREEQAQRVAFELDITFHLAKELLILAGGDEDMVIECSRKSHGLDHCKANILDARLSKANM